MSFSDYLRMTMEHLTTYRCAACGREQEGWPALASSPRIISSSYQTPNGSTGLHWIRIFARSSILTKRTGSSAVYWCSGWWTMAKTCTENHNTATNTCRAFFKRRPRPWPMGIHKGHDDLPCSLGFLTTSVRIQHLNGIIFYQIVVKCSLW